MCATTTDGYDQTMQDRFRVLPILIIPCIRPRTIGRVTAFPKALIVLQQVPYLLGSRSRPFHGQFDFRAWHSVVSRARDRPTQLHIFLFNDSYHNLFQVVAL